MPVASYLAAVIRILRLTPFNRKTASQIVEGVNKKEIRR
jgi:hypothetical protein